MTVGLTAAVGLLVAASAVALGLLIKGTRARLRVLGVVGTVLLALGLFSRIMYQWLVDRTLGRVDDETFIASLSVSVAVGGVLTGAGILLLTRAVVLAGRIPRV